MQPIPFIPVWGPGLLESVYDTLLVVELEKRRLRVMRSMKVAIFYEQR